MNDEELQEALLAEVPAPEGDYWKRVDGLLDPRDETAARHRLAAANAGSVTDITAASHQSQQSRDLRRRFRWPTAAAAAALLVFTGWFIGSRGPSDSTPIELGAQPSELRELPEPEGEPPLANRDHWNAVYAVWDCTADNGVGAWIPPFTSTRDDHGIHSHGDGIISIHPFSETSAGRNAQFGLFAESMGIEVTTDAITLDDGRRLEAGIECDGEPAVVQLQRWQFDFIATTDPRPEPTIVTSNFASERFMNDREVWVLALAPMNAELPDPPAERFAALDRRTQPGNPMEVWNGVAPRWLTPPPADRYLSAAPGLGDDPLATELFEIREQQNARAPGSIDFAGAPTSISHISSVHAPRQTIDVFQTEYVSEGISRSCTTTFSSSPTLPGAWLLCAQDSPDDSPVPRAHVARGQTIISVLTSDTPADARWLVIETETERRIVTDVVDGIAYAQLEAVESGSLAITLLDEDMNTVFMFEDS